MYTLRFFVFGLVLSLTSCSYISSDNSLWYHRDKDYTEAKSIPSITLPKGFSSEQMQENYPVPAKQYPPITQPINLAPPKFAN